LTIIDIHYLLVSDNDWAKCMAGAAGGFVIGFMISVFFFAKK
jgi:hypothetical protein